jgi:type II secretory pathway pseudopilin PulG
MPRSRRGPSPRSREGGFSFVELLLTLLLLSLVVGGIIPLLTQGDNAYQDLRRRQEMIQNARVALDKLLREARVAESFRVLSPALIRFTLFWGDGSGATPTAEYALNGASGDLEYRWSADWDYRRQITVTAVTALPAGYAVSVTVNHAALVSASKSLASGNDVRVRYWNGTEMIELDRVLDPLSTWDSAATRIWFRLQAALGAGGSSGNYYLYYGNLTAPAPPANGDNVFLDYEDGGTLGGWTRRDGCAPAPPAGYAASADGFVFTTASGNNCYRRLSKSVSHGDVEVFWGFRSGALGDAPANDRHMAGVGARHSNAGAGYLAVPGEDSNRRLRIREVTTWGTNGSVIAQTARDATLYRVTPGVDYYARFALVGSTLQAKFWDAGGAEPGGWMLTTTDATYATGLHYALVDGHDAPQNHRHRRVILRPRVATEPSTALGGETPGTRADPLESLAGPFRSMSVTCFNAAGGTIGCSPTTAVRSVQVALVVMDPDGRVPDITVTGRTFRQAP